MATTFTKTALPNVNALTGAVLTMTACDATNGNAINPATGTEVCVVMNVNASTTAHTFTITGVVDPFGRTSNFSMSVAASGAITTPSIIITPKLATNLWATAGVIGFPNTNNAELQVGVITGLY